MENVIVYDLDWDVLLATNVTQNPPTAFVKRQVFATPNLEKDLFFHPKKQWKSVEQAVNIPGRLSAFRLRFWENSTINLIETYLKTQQFFELPKKNDKNGTFNPMFPKYSVVESLNHWCEKLSHFNFIGWKHGWTQKITTKIT